MRLRVWVGLALAGSTLLGACILNPQPEPPDDDSSGSAGRGAAPNYDRDAGSDGGGPDGAPIISGDGSAEAGDGETDPADPADASDGDGGDGGDDDGGDADTADADTADALHDIEEGGVGS
jgi:hypothetical protein